MSDESKTLRQAAKLGRLSGTDWEQLQDCAERFEACWQKADMRTTVLDLATFLPPPEDRLRVVVLNELIKVDLEARWRRGQTVCLEEYLKLFPEMGAAESMDPSLVFEEFLVRQRHGDKPELKTYENRFPAQFPALMQLAQGKPLANTLLSRTLPAPAPPPPSKDAVPVAGEVLRLDGTYKLLRRIGSGSFGEVWRAEGPGGVEVAIKIVLGTVALEEAKRELQSLGLIRRLRHVFLLPIHAYWRLEDRLIIAMELADGSLRHREDECRRLGKPGIPAAELIRYTAEAAEALDYLHDRHLLHRDIKPENLLYVEGHVQVADFGLARVFEQTRRLVTTGGGGTPAFTPPEVFWQGKVGPFSDQYSLAATYAELRLGRPLFPGRNWNELMHQHLEQIPDLTPLPAAEQEVLQRALAKDTTERFGACSEFARALQQALLQVNE